MLKPVTGFAVAALSLIWALLLGAAVLLVYGATELLKKALWRKPVADDRHPVEKYRGNPL